MKLILAILCVMYAGSALAGSAGQSLTGGQTIGSVDGLGSSADTQVTYNCSGAICGDADMTFDGATATFAAIDILPNDGSNALYMHDNPTATGGFTDCATNAPSTNDGRFNLDSDDVAGFPFLCLDDGLNYQLPRFEQDDSLLGPTATTGWQINSGGIARFKQFIFIQPDEDATQSFGRIQTNFTGTGITSWVSDIRVGISYTNGSTMENNKKFIEFTKDGTDFFSLDADSGGGTAFHIWDLDNSNKLTVTPPDAISSNYAVTWPAAAGTILTNTTPFDVVTPVLNTAALSQAQVTNGRLVVDLAGGVEFDLPTAVSGLEACFYDNNGDTGILLHANTGDDMRLPDGTLIGVANKMISTSANVIGDFMCILAISDALWVPLENQGTWTDGGP